MNKKIIIITTLLCGLFSFQANAFENIKGLFGYQLGKTVDKNDTNLTFKNMPSAHFDMKKPLANELGFPLNSYSLAVKQLDEQTYLIKGILGFQNTPDMNTCLHMLSNTTDKFQNMYGMPNIDENKVVRFSDKDDSNKFIGLFCTDNNLFIFAYDKNN